MASPQPSPGMTLERRYFIDDDIFAAETENIFHHRWLHLVRESALENSGDFITVNLAGLPALSLPVGFDPSGLPIGMQVIGNYLDEGTLLTIGQRFQEVTDWHLRAPGEVA